MSEMSRSKWSDNKISVHAFVLLCNRIFNNSTVERMMVAKMARKKGELKYTKKQQQRQQKQSSLSVNVFDDVGPGIVCFSCLSEKRKEFVFSDLIVVICFS